MVEEMGRWLRRVRPGTVADDDWSSSPQAQEMLAAIHAATAASTPRRSRRPAGIAIWLPAGGLACAVVAIVALAVSGGTQAHPAGPGRTGIAQPQSSPAQSSPARQLPAQRPPDMLLAGDTSCPTLLASLRTHTAATAAAGHLGVQVDAYRGTIGDPLAAGAVNGVATSEEGLSDTSRTNDQQSGVDEPDIVKTDGANVITITDGTLRVVNAASRSVTGSLDLTIYQGWANAQLLTDGSNALVILGGAATPSYSYGPDVLNGGSDNEGYGNDSDTSSLSTYLFVDLSGQPTVTGSLRASGRYLAARLVGSTIRLVVQSAPAINLPQPYLNDSKSDASNRAAVLRAPLAAWLPKYTLTRGSVASTHTVGCAEVSHPASYSGASLLTIYTLDMTHLGADPHPVTVAADGDTVYATSSSLYVTSNPDSFCCTTKPGMTEIHRFDITGASAPTYLGSASVSGQLLNQYSLSDYDGYLRVATTVGAQGSRGESSRVVILRADTLTLSGEVGDLGRSEQIYAVRYLGPIAYVVTFKDTDPLYILDLSDPQHPTLAGSLELSGFSDYLDDAGDGRLIGVGQQASSSGEVAGLQASLFDVATLTDPRRVGHVVLSNAPGEAQLDPHAFLYWQPTGLVVIPVQSWNSTESGKVLVLRVSGLKLSEVGLVANPLSSTSVDDGLGIQRSLIVEDNLWTVSGSGVRVSSQQNLASLAWIPFS